MKRLTRSFLFVALFLSVSSCPTKDRPLPPANPPPPQADFTMKGYYPGNAPLAGPGFFFYMMMAQTELHEDVFT